MSMHSVLYAEDRKASCADSDKLEILSDPNAEIERLGSNEAYVYGYCFEIGNGVKQDFNRAISLYQQSAKLDNAKAQFRWGYLLGPDSPFVGPQSDYYINPNLDQSIELIKKNHEQLGFLIE
jgi:TPR repeat protein